MHKKYYYIMVVLLTIMSSSVITAQESQDLPKDNKEKKVKQKKEPKQKREKVAKVTKGKTKLEIEHTVGLQANELLKQINLFGNNSATISNPYLLTYALGLPKIGLEFNFGFGADIANTNQTEDNVEVIDSKINTRIGLTKLFDIGKRFEFGLGFDFLYNTDKFKSETFSSAFDPFTGDFIDTTTLVEDNENRLGGGLRLSLDYQITPRVLIGTESYFYFKAGDDEFKSQVFQSTQGNSQVPVFISDDEVTNVTELKLTPPAVLYLKVRF